MSERRMLTIEQAARWRSSWSSSDRRLIGYVLNSLPQPEVYDRGHEVTAEVGAKRAFVIRPGFVYWPRGEWATNIPPELLPAGLLEGQERDGTRWTTLSTYEQPHRTGAIPEKPVAICGRCNEQLPATGICDWH